VGGQPQVVAAGSSHRAPPNILPPGRKPHGQAVGERPLHQVAAPWRPLLRRALMRDNRPNGADLARAAGAIPCPVSIARLARDTVPSLKPLSQKPTGVEQHPQAMRPSARSPGSGWIMLKVPESASMVRPRTAKASRTRAHRAEVICAGSVGTPTQARSHLHALHAAGGEGIQGRLQRGTRERGRHDPESHRACS
jgi:hypothetical protein